jgi:magnesium-transporting ATPase (P-type)
VGMIQEADIGVGISGVEGMQVGNKSNWHFLHNVSLYEFVHSLFQFNNSYAYQLSQ